MHNIYLIAQVEVLEQELTKRPEEARGSRQEPLVHIYLPDGPGAGVGAGADQETG